MTKDTVLHRVEIIMGSQSDWPTMEKTAVELEKLEIPYKALVVSAHRTPHRLYKYASKAADRGIQIIIAGAGGAAHLPGMTAALTHLPVIAVPVKSSTLSGVDSLLSICQMPGGVPVATMSIGDAGARNAGLYAARILALMDPALEERLMKYITDQADSVPLTP